MGAEIPAWPRLRVIGAGHGRTGTTSLKVALEKLYQGKCYHMDEITKGDGLKKGHCDIWEAMADAKASGDKEKVMKLGRPLLEPYCAAVDWPPSLFYEELMEAFPDTKIILTTRDMDKWYDSVIDTIWAIRRALDGSWQIGVVPFVKRFAKFIDHIVWTGPSSLWKGSFGDKEKAIQAHKDWIVHVKKTVPPERLLIFDVKEGYKPLCKFLNLPEPDEPFPNSNDKSEFQKIASIIRTVDMIGKILCFPCWGIKYLMCCACLTTPAKGATEGDKLLGDSSV